MKDEDMTKTHDYLDTQKSNELPSKPSIGRKRSGIENPPINLHKPKPNLNDYHPLNGPFESD